MLKQPSASAKLKALKLSKTSLKGSATVEVAATLFFFLFVVFLILDAAIFMYNSVATEYLASSAVRYAIVRGTDAQIEDIKENLPLDDMAAKQEITAFIKNRKLLVNYKESDLNVTVNFIDGPDNGIANRNPGDKVEVTIETVYNSLWPLISNLLNLPLKHKSEGTYVY